MAHEGVDPVDLKRWFTETVDIRMDEANNKGEYEVFLLERSQAPATYGGVLLAFLHSAKVELRPKQP